MRVVSHADAIPPPYPGRSSVVMGFLSCVSPHPRTLRQDYVVPVNRRAIIQHATLYYFVDGAPTGEGTARTSLELSIAGGPNSIILQLAAHNLPLNRPTSATLGAGLMLEAGDRLEMYTEDGATNGALCYTLHMYALEFDG